MSEFSFEQAIGAMLQDPEQMQKIFALAQSLGFSPPAAQQAPPPPPEPQASPSPTPKQEASPPDDRQQALGELARGKTVIMIAHRLSTVANADRIFVLRDGKVIEDGRFDELKAQNGLFADMWSDYQKSVQWKVAKEA